MRKPRSERIGINGVGSYLGSGWPFSLRSLQTTDSLHLRLGQLRCQAISPPWLLHARRLRSRRLHRGRERTCGASGAQPTPAWVLAMTLRAIRSGSSPERGQPLRRRTGWLPGKARGSRRRLRLRHGSPTGLKRYGGVSAKIRARIGSRRALHSRPGFAININEFWRKVFYINVAPALEPGLTSRHSGIDLEPARGIWRASAAAAPQRHISSTGYRRRAALTCWKESLGGESVSWRQPRLPGSSVDQLQQGAVLPTQPSAGGFRSKPY